jgi:hypothetical protein
MGDHERAAQAEAERDFLVHELARAVDLGGRYRSTASMSERASASVTRAVRQAMAHIQKHHPVWANIWSAPFVPGSTAPTCPILKFQRPGRCEDCWDAGTAGDAEQHQPTRSRVRIGWQAAVPAIASRALRLDEADGHGRPIALLP